METQVVQIEVDPETGDYILPLNDDILAGAGLQVGDTVKWTVNEDGTASFRKQEPMEWVLVEAVSTFRMRYMVQVPQGKAEWALDTVALEQAKEFSQEHLGEHIVSHRVISEDDALDLCDQDNSYCSPWSDDKKKEVFFTHDGELVEK